MREKKRWGKNRERNKDVNTANGKKLTGTEQKVNAGDSVGSLNVSDLKYMLTEATHTHTPYVLKLNL